MLARSFPNPSERGLDRMDRPSSGRSEPLINYIACVGAHDHVGVGYVCGKPDAFLSAVAEGSGFVCTGTTRTLERDPRKERALSAARALRIAVGLPSTTQMM